MVCCLLFVCQKPYKEFIKEKKGVTISESVLFSIREFVCENIKLLGKRVDAQSQF